MKHFPPKQSVNCIVFYFPHFFPQFIRDSVFVSYCQITKASTNYRQRKGGWAQLCVGWAASWYQSPYVMSLSPDWHLNTTTTTLQPPTPAPPVITIVIDCHRPLIASLFFNSYLIIKLVLFLFGECLKVARGERLWKFFGGGGGEYKKNNDAFL